MQKLFSSFPNGRFGIGLLILRILASASTSVYSYILLNNLEAVTTGQFAFFGYLIPGLLLLITSIFFLFGLIMPFISISVMVFLPAAAFIGLVPANVLQANGFGPSTTFLLAGIALALAFLGPGSFSIDARLFGRKRIFIPPSLKETGKKN